MSVMIIFVLVVLYLFAILITAGKPDADKAAKTKLLKDTKLPQKTTAYIIKQSPYEVCTY